MQEDNFNPYYPQQQLFPHQQLNRGERYVMRKRKNFWGEEIIEFYVVKHVDDAPVYKFIMMVFVLSLVMFGFSKCGKESSRNPAKDKVETQDRLGK